MEEVASIHGLLSRINLEISLPLALPLIILLFKTLSNCTIYSLSTFFLNTNEGNLFGKKKKHPKWGF